jgi:hypothetical protein
MIHKFKGYLITGMVCLGLGAIASTIFSGYKLPQTQSGDNNNLAKAANIVTATNPDPLRADLTYKLQICYRDGGYVLPDLTFFTSKQLNDALYNCYLARS